MGDLAKGIKSFKAGMKDEESRPMRRPPARRSPTTIEGKAHSETTAPRLGGPPRARNRRRPTRR